MFKNLCSERSRHVPSQSDESQVSWWPPQSYMVLSPTRNLPSPLLSPACTPCLQCPPDVPFSFLCKCCSIRVLGHPTQRRAPSTPTPAPPSPSMLLDSYPRDLFSCNICACVHWLSPSLPCPRHENGGPTVSAAVSPGRVTTRSHAE